MMYSFTFVCFNKLHFAICCLQMCVYLLQLKRLLAANFTHWPSWVYKQYDAVSQ